MLVLTKLASVHVIDLGYLVLGFSLIVVDSLPPLLNSHIVSADYSRFERAASIQTVTKWRTHQPLQASTHPRNHKHRSRSSTRGGRRKSTNRRIPATCVRVTPQPLSQLVCSTSTRVVCPLPFAREGRLEIHHSLHALVDLVSDLVECWSQKARFCTEVT